MLFTALILDRESNCSMDSSDWAEEVEEEFRTRADSCASISSDQVGNTQSLLCTEVFVKPKAGACTKVVFSISLF